MNVTDVAPVRLDRPEYLEALNWLFILLALVSFMRVSTYAARQLRQSTLIGTHRSPKPFEVPPLAGWLFTIAVIFLFLDQSPLAWLVVVAGTSSFLVLVRSTAEQQFGLGRLSMLALLKWALLICGAVFFLEIPLARVVDQVMTLLRWPHPEQQAVEIFRHYSKPSEIVLFLLQAVIISPMIEEVFFRGFLFSFLKRFTSTWAALVLSAGVFAFAHANLGSVLQLWLLGLVLGVAYENTGALLLPMSVHGCFNLVTAVALLVQKGSP